MPFVSNFSLTTTSPPTNPYIYNFDKTNQVSSILNNCNGSITNVGITGGTPPYTITWIGPDSFTGNSLNLTNLCATRSDDENECVIYMVYALGK